jgi:L-fuconolactonase
VIVDSHVHASRTWFEPAESLLYQMDRYDVARAVLIQLLGEYDNAYQQTMARRHPDRLASVVAVDARDPRAPDTLSLLAEEGAAGLRLRPTDRSPGADPLAIWRAAERLGLAVSCVGRPGHLASAEFSGLLAELPRLTVVIEHLGGAAGLARDEQARELRRAVFGLARFPGIYIKVPGLGEFAERAAASADGDPFLRPVPPYLGEALGAFGPRRLMWGSDYPPVSAREGYGNALRLCQAEFADLAASQRELIFGGAAAAVFFAG